ncbi:MAG TPA: hypothetical protein VHI31_03610 [Actinomycetota bacterium]|nr:hypothetical protein [Actinomycetota bacterium]
MAEGHGEPLTDAQVFEELPEEAKDEIRADVARLRANLPIGEIMNDEPVGIGATSAGLLVVKTAHAAYQLMEDGSTVKVSGGPNGMIVRTYLNGDLVENPPGFDLG